MLSLSPHMYQLVIVRWCLHHSLALLMLEQSYKMSGLVRCSSARMRFLPMHSNPNLRSIHGTNWLTCSLDQKLSTLPPVLHFCSSPATKGCHVLNYVPPQDLVSHSSSPLLNSLALPLTAPGSRVASWLGVLTSTLRSIHNSLPCC